MTIVTVNRLAPKIKVKASDSGLLTSGFSSVTIQNQGQVVAATNRLDQLDDVIEGTPQDGDYIQYVAATDKYVVGPLQVNNTQLDGGEF